MVSEIWTKFPDYRQKGHFKSKQDVRFMDESHILNPTVLISKAFLSLYLVTPGLVVVLGEQLRNLLHVHSVVEGGGVSHLALVRTELALKALD